MHRRNRLKDKIAAGTPVVGMWLGMPSPTSAEVAAAAGFDFVIIDNEHGQMTLETSIDMMRAVMGTDTEAMIRVPGHDPDFLKRVLDAGATSLMVPMVHTAAQAEAVVAACRYPPRGSRGYAAPGVRASRYGIDADYVDWAHESLLLLVQIESVEAVGNSEAIARVDGVDMLFIGLSDLSGSAGRLADTGHKDVVSLMRACVDGAKKAGKPVGTIPRPGVGVNDLMKDGLVLAAGAVDVMMLREAAVAHVAAFRKAHGG